MEKSGKDYLVDGQAACALAFESKRAEIAKGVDSAMAVLAPVVVSLLADDYAMSESDAVDLLLLFFDAVREKIRSEIVSDVASGIEKALGIED